MALTEKQVREILSAAGVSAENMGNATKAIMDGHTTSINALREQRDAYKADAEKLPGVQKELDDLKAIQSGTDDYKAKFEKEHSDFEAYKAGIQEKESTAAKDKVYRKLLKDLNIDERRHDAIMRVTDLKPLKIKDGKFTTEDEVKKAITENWGDFVVKTKTEPSGSPENPPANGGNGGTESRAAQLQKAYNENLYGVQKTDAK